MHPSNRAAKTVFDAFVGEQARRPCRKSIPRTTLYSFAFGAWDGEERVLYREDERDDKVELTDGYVTGTLNPVETKVRSPV